jgi:hypothetical protein
LRLGKQKTQHLVKQRAGALRYLGPPRPGPLQHPAHIGHMPQMGAVSS